MPSNRLTPNQTLELLHELFIITSSLKEGEKREVGYLRNRCRELVELLTKNDLYKKLKPASQNLFKECMRSEHLFRKQAVVLEKPKYPEAMWHTLD